MVSRRGFLKLAGVLGMAPLVPHDHSPTRTPDFSPRQFRVVQGTTNSRSTILTLMAHRNSRLKIQVLDQNENQLFFHLSKVDLSLGDFVLHHVFVDQLKPGQDYILSVYDQAYSLFHKRVFRSLDWDHKDPKIALISCSNHRDADSKDIMFQRLFESDPDMIFFIGDLVYGNSVLDTLMGRAAEPHEAYAVYTKTLIEFELYSRERLIPIFSCWDDHDMAFNNSDSRHPHKELMLKIFRAFFPCDPRVEGIEKSTGAGYSFEAFGFQFIFLDGRYHKDPKSKTFLGSQQLKWVEEKLKTSGCPVVFLSSQQFWSYRFFAESFQGSSKEEFSEFLETLRKTGQSPLFLSGDVHYSQIQEIGFENLGFKTYEITSSALFSSSARGLGKRSPQEGQLDYYGQPNFLLLEGLKSLENGMALTISCQGEQKKNIFRRSLQIQK